MSRHDDELEDHDRGLSFDAETLARRGLVTRRKAIGLLAGAAGAGAVLALPSPASAAAVAKTPSETAGPYPGDGSNGPDALSESGVFRRNITGSFGTATGRATGVPLSIHLHLVHAATGAPYEGAAFYLWHCDRLGRYSMYSTGIRNQNYLRGVQVTGPQGNAWFRSIFPGCYSGRWPHIHFEVYRNRRSATSTTGRLLTSQIALPANAARAVYQRSDYPGSLSNFNSMRIRDDNVFGDGWGRETPTVSGNVTDGYSIRHVVSI
jgi:protocatechuate 3,4-dioxygenase beta subunit